MNEKFKVLCKNCKSEHVIEQNQIRIVPVGYKGNIKCYTICNNCQKEIILPIKMADKKTLNKVLREY